MELWLLFGLKLSFSRILDLLYDTF